MTKALAWLVIVLSSVLELGAAQSDLLCRCERQDENLYNRRQLQRMRRGETLSNGYQIIDDIVVIPKTRPQCKVERYIVNNSVFFRGIKVFYRRNLRSLRTSAVLEADEQHRSLARGETFPCPPGLGTRAPGTSGMTRRPTAPGTTTSSPASPTLVGPTSSPGPSAAIATPAPNTSSAPSVAGGSLRPSSASLSLAPSISSQPTTTTGAPSISNAPSNAPSSLIATSQAPSITPSISSMPSISAAPSGLLVPTVSPAPTSFLETMGPTRGSSAPSVSASPSVSAFPSRESIIPTVSARPSISAAPSGQSLVPSISQRPSVSAEPSGLDGPSAAPGPTRLPRPSTSLAPSISAAPSVSPAPSSSSAPSGPKGGPGPTTSTSIVPSTSPAPTTTASPTVTSSPTNTASPTTSGSPGPTTTASPTPASGPTSTSSLVPSLVNVRSPTTSPGPTSSPAPSSPPTVSAGPSTSSAPSTTADGNVRMASAASNLVTLLRSSPKAMEDATWKALELPEQASQEEGAERSVAYSESGKFMVVGYPGANQNTGLIRVMERSNGAFRQRGSDIVGDAAGDNFGSSVSVSEKGDVVIVGAENARDERGQVKAYKFDFVQKTWKDLGSPMDGDQAGAGFGSTVAASEDGKIVAIGAPNVDTDRPGSVSVYGYSESSMKWINLGLSLVGSENGDMAGFSLDLSSNGYILAVGLPGKDGVGSSQTDAGSVVVYEYMNGNWIQLGQSLDGEMSFAKMGTSVSLSNDGQTLSLGQPGLGASGNGDAGAVVVYKYMTSTETWMQFGDAITGQANGDKLGQSLSLSGDGSTMGMYAGSYFGDDSSGRRLEEGAGQVGGLYSVYSWSGTNWVPIGPSIIAASVSRYYTISMGKNGSSVLVGFEKDNSLGYAAVYELDAAVLAEPKPEMSFEEQNDRVKCIAVIDGNSDTNLASQWTNLRTTFPQRGFCLLRPQSTSASLSIPSSLRTDSTSIIKSVARDDDADSEASDWYDLCSLQADFEMGLDRVILYIHETPTMSSDSVQASYELFLEKSSLMGFDVVYGNIADQQDYVSPCLEAPAQSPPPTSAPTEFSGWDKTSRLTGDRNGEHFGVISYNSDGSVMAVGSPGANDDTGKVQIFSRIDDRWQQVGDDLRGEVTAGQFGASVALSADGTTVVAGAPFANQVRVYRWKDGNWRPLGSYLTASDSNSDFGYAVATNAFGTKIAIGSPDTTLDEPGTGTIEVFGYSENDHGWQRLGVTLEGVENGDMCGASLSMNAAGSLLAVGCPGRRMKAGLVTVYDINNWKQLGQDIFGVDSGDEAGTDISLASEARILAVGIPNASPTAGIEMAGQVKVYKYYDASKTWLPMGNVISGEFASARIGKTVDLTANGAMIAYYDGPYLEEGYLSGGLVSVRALNDLEKWTLVRSPIILHTVSKWYNVDISGDGSSVIVGFDDSSRSGVVESYTPTIADYNPGIISLQSVEQEATPSGVDEFTCVAVIDENKGRNMDSKWKTLDETFPKRPFCLLRPVPPGTSGGLAVPDAFDDNSKNIFAEVNRDDQDRENPADWYSECNIGLSKRKNIQKVALYVDNSTSMSRSSVSIALVLFQERLKENNMELVFVTSNVDKDYVSPCLAAGAK
ncbi:hypothetical protein MPSEU_000200200 [Mayamaea pseudoterrestris]|nr:hypothetical protein MPSEU_000200200 [Mayamaea pseudoterrestris]